MTLQFIKKARWDDKLDPCSNVSPAGHVSVVRLTILCIKSKDLIFELSRQHLALSATVVAIPLRSPLP
jgi:hypothetical protein